MAYCDTACEVFPCDITLITKKGKRVYGYQEGAGWMDAAAEKKTGTMYMQL